MSWGKRSQENRDFPLKAEAMVSEECHMGLLRAISSGKTTQGTRKETQAGRNWMEANSSPARKHLFVSFNWDWRTLHQHLWLSFSLFIPLETGEAGGTGKVSRTDKTGIYWIQRLFFTNVCVKRIYPGSQPPPPRSFATYQHIQKWLRIKDQDLNRSYAVGYGK